MAGFNVGHRQVLREGRVLNEEQLLRFLCVSCKNVVRDPYQLSCGHHMCYSSCKPVTETFVCPRCKNTVVLGKGFRDKCFQKEVLVLVVVCECKVNFPLDIWEDHEKSCPEIVREKSRDGEIFELESNSSTVKSPMKFPVPEENIEYNDSIGRSHGLNSEDKSSRPNDFQGKLENVSQNLGGSLVSISSLKESPLKRPGSEIVLNSTTASSQYQAMVKVRTHLTANPVVLVIYVTNDGSHAPSHLRPSSNKPPLIAEKSAELLIPKFLDCGYCVIAEVNESKSCLEALLDVLGQKHLSAFGINLTFPDSIKVVMFISSTHGRCDHICLNGEAYSIPEILQRLSRIPCDAFLAIFDGCQIDEKSFGLRLVQKSYMAFYASPPELPTFHVDGVGICMICLSEILPEGISTPQDFFDHLRRAYDERLPNHWKDVNLLQPVSVQNFITNAIDLQELTTMALKPQIKLISQSGIMVEVDIQTPKKLLHHPEGNFELLSLSVLVKGLNGEQELKKALDLEFQRNYRLSLELPPRPDAANEDLYVVAHYRNGWEIHSDAVQVSMPLYVKPQILSYDRINCQPVMKIITGEENERSEPYNVTVIEVQCLLNDEWKQVGGDTVIRPSNDEQSVPITLPHSRADTKHQVRVIKHYEGTSAKTVSEIFEVDQGKLGSPQLLHIKNTRCHKSKVVKFAIASCCIQCACDSSDCRVKYRIHDAWHYCESVTKQGGEITAQIPFKATAVQADVTYNQIGVISSPTFPIHHHFISKFIRSILCYCCLNPCRSLTQLSLVISKFVLILLLALLVSWFPKSQSSESVMVAGFTMVPSFHNPSILTRMLYKGVHIHFDFQETADNPNMSISIITSDSMKIKNTTLKEPYNITLSNNGHQLCQYLPNQYSFPSYFLKDSTISGTVFIKSASDVVVHSAKLYGFSIFRSDGCSKEETKSEVFISDLMSGLNKPFSFKNYTLKDDSLVYFMVRTTASSNIQMYLTLIRYFNYYQDPTELPAHSYTVIDTAGPGHDAFIPFSPFAKHKYYISVEDFDEMQSQIGHFEFTFVPRDELKWIGIGILSFLIGAIAIQLCCAFCYMPCRRYCKTREVRGINVNNERTPLLQT